jgi:hypothetical protein
VIPETPLCTLAIKYGTDKAPQLRTYPVTEGMALPSHAYTPYYHELFKDRRESVQRVLEIGIYEWGGLHMWRDYFPNAMIFGFDNQREFLHDEERIKTFYCDASDEKSLLEAIVKIGGKADLIVDDASHVPADQIRAANVLVPYVASGGFYIIEDVGHPRIVSMGMDYSHELVEFRENEMKNDDDRLVVIRR